MPLSTAKQALNDLADEWGGPLPRDQARAESELAELAIYLIRLAGECGVDLAYVTNKRLHCNAAAKKAPSARPDCSTSTRQTRH
jgi:hypothetical protein